jgi:agmatine/peptidylarginine deiminase
MRILTTLFILFLCSFLAAQDLPNFLSPEEKLLAPLITFDESSARSVEGITLPPAVAVRTAAEWEEMQGYMVTWTSYTSMLRQIIKYGREECRMYVITDNPATVYSSLLNNGIDTSNVTCITAPFNSVWSRDYGHNNIYYNGVDSLAFVDWIYNRITRPKDDTVPASLARALGVTMYSTTQAPYNLVNTGGNWMSDGMGTAFASKLILDDNKASAGFGVNHTEAEIDTIMKKFHGINRYIKMETLPYDGIHHIDMHMKLLDEETILVGEYPQGVADGPQIEANLQYVLNNYQTSFGTDWRVVRIPMPSDNGQWPSGNGDYLTYTNAAFINKTIIVPTYNIPADTTALRIWREACPGYKVVGINSTSSIPASGALHCITHEIGVADPLLINHKRLRDTYNTNSPYTAFAYIKHRSGIQSATLYYTTDTTQPYQPVAMYDVFGDHYEANIPAQPAGTEVFYYIHAQANNGKQQVRPITAPQGFYNFKVLGTTAVKAESSNLKFEILSPFPNSSKGITCLPITTSDPQSVRIECLNVLSEKIETVFEGTTKTGDNKYFLNTTDFAAGVYLLQYTIGNQTTVRRLIVR